MAGWIVVGLFRSKGIALDAFHRLKTEGVPAADVFLQVLSEAAPVPPGLAPELEALNVDPLMIGNIRDNYVDHIANGETVVLVQARSEQEVELAAGTLKLYAPVDVRVITPAEHTQIVAPRPIGG
ncbi:MAG: hypothetical protein JO267_11670 [Alphaproteobacteria bacterium]|nr:hypothetical protein [Alphaproteobacteria bacterium]